MSTLTITLPDDRIEELKERAERLRVAPEDLVRVSVEDLLARPEEDFRRALEYVLENNAELYRRLAKCAIWPLARSWNSTDTSVRDG